MSKRKITTKEAISLLKDGEFIHTIRQGSSAIIMGCDLPKKEIIQLLNDNSDKIELSGFNSRRMNHGIVINIKPPLFLETDVEKLNCFDCVN